MTSPIPYLGSKISLISKSEIRYEGILYTIDAQDSIIALAKVRSFGTEDRPTEMPVPARDEVYEYIIFRGTDIKKIEVCEAPQKAQQGAIHNDPAIVQASSFPAGGGRQSLGPIGAGAPSYGYGQPIGQQGLPGAGGFSGGVSGAAAGVPPSAQPTDILTGSRSPTPNQLSARKSPHSDAGVQATSPPQQDGRRKQQQQHRQDRPNDGGEGDFGYARNRNNYNNDDRYGNRQMRDGSGGGGGGGMNRRNNQPFHQNQGYNMGGGGGGAGGYNQGYNQGYNPNQYRNQYQNQNQFYGGYQGRGGGGMSRGGGGGAGATGGGGGGGMNLRGGPGSGRRPRGGSGLMGRGGTGGQMYVSSSRQREDKRIFEKDYDFEQANTQFEELRVQLASTKICSPGGSSSSTTNTPAISTLPPVAGEAATSENGDANGEKDKKDDSGTDTGPADDSNAEDQQLFYDKAKSFFDNISCEAVERSQGRSQRPDWRLERKINQETFGVATSRRGNFYRGRGGYYNNRGGGGYNSYRGGYNQGGYYRGGMGGGYRGGRGGGGSRGGGPTNGSAATREENGGGAAAAAPAAHAQAVPAQ